MGSETSCNFSKVRKADNGHAHAAVAAALGAHVPGLAATSSPRPPRASSCIGCYLRLRTLREHWALPPCLPWSSRPLLPEVGLCCCPQDSQCIANALSCRCRMVIESPGDVAGDRHPPSSWIALPAGVMFLLLFCLKCFCTRENAQARQQRRMLSPYGGRYYQYESANGQRS